MIYLMMVDGSPRHIPDAETAELAGAQLVCRSREGFIVAVFDAPLVCAYGKAEFLAQDFRVEIEAA